MALQTFKEVIQNKGYRINSNDRAIFEEGNLQSFFGLSDSDLIEFVVYDANDNQLPQSNYGRARYIKLSTENIKDYILIPMGTEFQKYKFPKEYFVDVERLLKEAGYTNGIFKTQITLVNSRAGRGDENTSKLWISEISPSRTEIRLYPLKKGLEEHADLQERFNIFLNNRNFRDRDRIFAEQAEKESQRLENEKKKIEEEKQKGLAIENFPTLMSSNILPKVNDNKKSISFLEKVTTNNIKNNEDINKEKLEFDDLKPGWSILKTNSLTNQTIIKTKVIVSSEKEQILSESDIVYNVLNGLTNLYERRKQEYIDSWGEDEYEKMFKFQNYNYNYFDELDEKYEKEMKKYSEYYGENDNEYEDDEYYE